MKAAVSAADLGFVHRFVASPAGRKHTLLLLHGTGGDEQDLIRLGHRLSPDAALLSPRGRVLENGAPRFFRRVAQGVFDQQDLELQTHALAAFVQLAAKKYEFEESGIIAVGYSNGANIASSLMLRHPGLLSGAVLFRPMVPFVPQTLPDLRGKEIFVGAADRDEIVERRETQGLAGLFQTAGAVVTVHWHPGGHELGEDDVVAAADWISESLSRPSDTRQLQTDLNH